MKILLSLLGAVVLTAATAADSAAPKTSDAAPDAETGWAEVEKALGDPGDMSSPEKIGAAYDGMVAKLNDFIERFPDDGKTVQARIVRAQVALAALQFGKPAITSEEIVEDLRAVLADEATPEEKKPMCHVTLIQHLAKSGSAEDVETELDVFESAYPDAKMPFYMKKLLAGKLKDSNPERAGKLEEEAAAEEAKMKAAREQAVAKMKAFEGKPLEIAFTATDGREVDVQKMPGKVVLVDFWATWCGPCVAEIPAVLAAYEKYHDKGFEIVGISFDRDKDALLKMTKEKGMPWPQYFHDGEGDNPFGEKFGIRGIPTMWLVNKEGVLVELNARQDLDGKIARLLAE